MQSFASSFFVSTASNKSFKQREKDLYKSFIVVCKFDFIEFKSKNGDSLSYLTPSNFKTIMQEQNIQLSLFEELKNGKNIIFTENGFTTTQRTFDLNVICCHGRHHLATKNKKRRSSSFPKYSQKHSPNYDHC